MRRVFLAVAIAAAAVLAGALGAADSVNELTSTDSVATMDKNFMCFLRVPPLPRSLCFASSVLLSH